MGRPPTRWLLPVEEVARRYAAGESLYSLAAACGVASGNAISRGLRRAGVIVRDPGGRPGQGAGRVVKGKARRVCRSAACSNSFETFPSSNKRYCQPRCRYSDPDLADLVASIIGGKHRLSEIDIEGLRATCAICGSVQIRRRVVRGRVHATRPTWRCRTAERAHGWARHYGLSISAVMAFVEDQHGACAICKRPFDGDFHVDHDHDTGKVRGLLCSQCNTGIGLLGDSPERLLVAVDYLRSRTAAHRAVAAEAPDSVVPES